MPTPHGRLYLKTYLIYFRSYIYLYIYMIFLFFNIQPPSSFTSMELIIAKREIDDVVVQKLKGRRKRKDFICVPGNFIQNVEFHYWYRGEKGIVPLFLIFFFEKREMDICNS